MGWIGGVAGALAIFTAIAGSQDLETGGTPSDTTLWIELILGVLLLLVALRQWRSRPEPGEEATMPGWMQKIDALKPGAALDLGVLLWAVNPKNLLLIVAAAVTLAQAELSGSNQTIAIAVFTLIGASTVAAPVLYRLIAGDGAQATLDRMRTWLGANNAAVMAVLMLVIGAKLIGDAISGFTAQFVTDRVRS